MTELGRNDPCHCGSGKKYKKCHLEKDSVKEHVRLEKEAKKIAPPVPADEKAKPGAPQAPREEKSWLGNIMGKVGFRRTNAPRRVGGGG